MGSFLYSLLDKILGPLIYIPISFFPNSKDYIKKSYLSSPNNKKILVIKLYEMGSTILCAPSIQLLQNEYSKEQIYFLVFRKYKEILLTMDLIEGDNILEININNPLSFLISLIRVLITARKLKFSISICLEFSNYIGPILSFLIGAKVKAGFYNSSHKILGHKNGLYNLPYEMNNSIHVYDLFAEIFCKTFNINRLNLSFTKFKVHFSSHKLLSNQGAVFRKSHKITKEDKIILFNLNISDELPLRKWPKEYYLKLSKLLLGLDQSLVIVFVGLMKDSKALNDLLGNDLLNENLSNRCINYLGKTPTLLEFIRLIESSDFFLTTDSGPGHFASLTKTKTVVLFGPETPTIFGPLSDNITNIYLNLTCSPCFSLNNGRTSNCRNNICLKGITPNNIYEIIKEKIYA